MPGDLQLGLALPGFLLAGGHVSCCFIHRVLAGFDPPLQRNGGLRDRRPFGRLPGSGSAGLRPRIRACP